MENRELQWGGRGAGGGGYQVSRRMRYHNGTNDDIFLRKEKKTHAEHVQLPPHDDARRPAPSWGYHAPGRQRHTTPRQVLSWMIVGGRGRRRRRIRRRRRRHHHHRLWVDDFIYPAPRIVRPSVYLYYFFCASSRFLVSIDVHCLLEDARPAPLRFSFRLLPVRRVLPRRWGSFDADAAPACHWTSLTRRTLLPSFVRMMMLLLLL
jgi:hypothetical protein